MVLAKFGSEIFERTSGKKYTKQLERYIAKKYGR